MSLVMNDLAALYKYYRIDPQLYPPPDLQLDHIVQQSPSPFYLQPFTIQKENTNRRCGEWKRNENGFRSTNRRRKKTNKKSITNNFHHRNMITVRRISCQDMFEKRFEDEQTNFQHDKIKNHRNNQLRSMISIENKSQKHQISPAGFSSSPSHVKVPMSPRPSILSRLSNSPSSTSTTAFFQQQELKKKRSNSMNRSKLKVTSVRDSSTSSLESTQLHVPTYNQIKPDINTTTATISDPQIDLESIGDHSLHLSTTSSSIVPHFSSTIAPHVPLHISSSTIVMPNTSRTEANVAPTITSETIQDLVKQLKTCIVTLSLLLRDKTEHGKSIIPNGKSYLDEKRNRTKKKQSQALLYSTPTRSRAASKENNLVFEDITVRQYNPYNDHEQQNYQRHISPSCYNQNEELKRCLLVYCRDTDHSNNINSNSIHQYSSFIWNQLRPKQELSAAQLNECLSNRTRNDSSISKSSLILAEEDDDDDEYDSLNELLSSIVSFK